MNSGRLNPTKETGKKVAVDYTLDFEIDATGAHYMLHYGFRAGVPSPPKPLAEMNREEYHAYFHSVLPLLHAAPGFWEHSARMHECAERFTL